MTCGMQTWVGAYVLDALEPDESENVRMHIAGCSICQDEVVSLSWIPPLLRTVQVESIEQPDDATADAPQLLDRLLARMSAARRDGRARRPVALLLGAAVAVTVTGAMMIGSGAFTGGHSTSRTAAIKTVDPHSQVRAAVTLRPRSWGTELHLTLSWVAPGEQCSLIAHSRDGRSDIAASWVATYKGTANVPGTTAIPADQLTGLDVMTAGGRQLVHIDIPHNRK